MVLVGGAEVVADKEGDEVGECLRLAAFGFGVVRVEQFGVDGDVDAERGAGLICVHGVASLACGVVAVTEWCRTFARIASGRGKARPL